MSAIQPHRRRSGLALLLAAAGMAMLWTGAAGADGHGATVSWQDRGQHFYDAARYSNLNMREMVESAVIKEVESKGYRFLAQADAGRLLLAYTIVLQDALTDAARDRVLAENPSLRSMSYDEQRLENGVATIKLVDAETRQTVWANTVRGVVVLDMSDEEREVRIAAIVTDIFASLQGPDGKE